MEPSISTLWIGSDLGPYEVLALRSFANLGYQVDLYAYSALGNVPLGIQVKSAAEIVPTEQVFANPDRPGTYAAFSNIFRYRLLQTRETVWIDTDVLAVGILPKSEYLLGWEDSHLINGAVLSLPRSSPILKSLSEEAENIGESVRGWGVLGPSLITSVVTRDELKSEVQPSFVFYPVHYREVWRLFDPKQFGWVEEATSQASTLHLWNEVLRTTGPGVKRSTPHPGSFMADMFRRHKVQAPRGPIVNLARIRFLWRARLNDFPSPFAGVLKPARRLVANR